MSLFTRIFGKNAQEKPPTPQEAIQRIRDVEELLGKQSELLEKKIDQELDVARKQGSKIRDVAIQALKRKKRYENHLQQIDGTLTTLEYQRETLENARTNAEILKVMAGASKAFKGANQDLDVDKIHELMDEISEQQQLANEITTAISNPVGFDNDVDEDDLLRELTELEQRQFDERFLDIPTPSINPRISNREPAATSSKQKFDDEDELRKIADWAS